MTPSKSAHFLLGTILCCGLGFLSLAFTAMTFSLGGLRPLALLGVIWGFYFVFQLLRWTFLSNVWLAAFVGFALGLLRELDRFDSHPWAHRFTGLPEEWIGRAGWAFFFIFVALLPWLATRLAERLTSRESPSA